MLRVAYCTDVGKKRTNNQDALLVSLDLNLFAVADGMGGHLAGEVASQTTVDLLEKYFLNLSDTLPQIWVEESIKEANKRVYLKSLEEESYRGMGTTCSMVYFKDDMLHIGHVGDSRIYFIDEDIKQVSRDHTLVDNLLKAGEITKAEADNHPKRHVITRAIGTDATVDVDYDKYDYKGLNKILICSDGLSEMVKDQEILSIVNTHDIESAVTELVKQANDNGGTDNISVILIALNEY
ncbi:Stp1/IreP family PP2C-type Ser/Thr phosphatase [Acidaminobacter sp. JC074]|uniref:Stp1/IreP family PP2C-type Ser/Thr phosphatase n=1 Tax=Acidaminobacter sp. JC074 TaxID=2530199 RepID=UPI001F104CB9|nr:Stp1/IreP family PP2C-type Ser/Thr phosphatase [Acidaminobacter sp. JC074]MCH4890262.1 Stp1/IreP family PP2C-type Ser/Thr phosphatase [Acidaminobacter sp. JC074]